MKVGRGESSFYKVGVVFVTSVGCAAESRKKLLSGTLSVFSFLVLVSISVFYFLYKFFVFNGVYFCGFLHLFAFRVVRMASFVHIYGVLC